VKRLHPRFRSAFPADSPAGSRRRLLAARASVVVGLATCAVVGSPAFAFAAGPGVNEISSSKPLGAVNAILIFAVAPIATLLLISAIFLRPGSAPGSQRYRPGRGWHAEPEWVGVPEREHHEDHAMSGADTLADAAEGLTHEHVGELEADGPVDPSSRRQGGAHGSW
jgi:hypothetical protein